MKKIGKILMVIAIAAVFIGTFAYLFRRSQPKEIQYQELVPETGNISKSTVVTGKIQPRDEVNVKPQINGISTRRPAKPLRRTRSSPSSRSSPT